MALKARAKYVVGVYSKSRQAVTLYPVDSLLALGQRVKGVEHGPAAAAAAASADTMSYAERRKSLVETFGTKKKRRVMQSQEENRIRAEGVVGLCALGGFLADAVEAVKEEAAAQGQTPTAAEASRATLLPPYDANARSADRVYSASRVLPGPDAWEGLGMDVQQLAERVGVGIDGEVDAEALRAAVLEGWRHWPAFVRSRLQDAPMPTAVPAFDPDGSTQAQAAGDARWGHLCALLLLRHLFDLHRLPPVLKGGAPALAKMLGNGGGEPANEAVAEACLEAFFQPPAAAQQQGDGGGGGGGGGRHTRTKPLTDKLLLHILVLCLVVGGYRVSASKCVFVRPWETTMWWWSSLHDIKLYHPSVCACRRIIESSHRTQHTNTPRPQDRPGPAHVPRGLRHALPRDGRLHQARLRRQCRCRCSPGGGGGGGRWGQGEGEGEGRGGGGGGAGAATQVPGGQARDSGQEVINGLFDWLTSIG